MHLCALQVPENALDSVEVSSMGSMHELGNYMDRIGISERVMVKYYNGPTMFRYSVASASSSLSIRDKAVRPVKGVVIGFIVWRWNLWRRSATYFYGERKIPMGVQVT